MDSEEGNAAGNDSQSLPTLSGEPKGSRPRRTFEEMAGLRVNELESLKKLDVSSWSGKKKEIHARNIEILTARVAANTTKLKKSTLKRSKSFAVAQGVEIVTVVRAPPRNEGEEI